MIRPVNVTLRPALAFNCSTSSGDASRVKSNRPVTLPIAKAGDPDEDAPDLAPPKGEYVLELLTE